MYIQSYVVRERCGELHHLDQLRHDAFVLLFQLLHLCIMIWHPDSLPFWSTNLALHQLRHEALVFLLQLLHLLHYTLLKAVSPLFSHIVIGASSVVMGSCSFFPCSSLQQLFKQGCSA